MDRTIASRMVDARRAARARSGMAALAVAGLLAAAAGCTKSTDHAEGVEQKTSAIAVEIASILGFESTAGWRAPVALASSTTRSQGARSLAVTVNGWTEVTSLDLSSMGSIASSVSYDLRLPQTVSWGETRLVIVAPSLGIVRLDLGSRSLVGKPAGSFQTYTFSLPSAVEAALEGSYSDLEFKVVISAPAASSPYLLDNLNVGPTGATPSTQRTTSFPLPDGVRRRDVALAANGILKVGDDARTVTSGGGYAPVANSGTGTSTTYYGFNAFTGSLTSRPDVTLKDGAIVTGDLLDCRGDRTRRRRRQRQRHRQRHRARRLPDPGHHLYRDVSSGLERPRASRAQHAGDDGPRPLWRGQRQGGLYDLPADRRLLHRQPSAGTAVDAAARRRAGRGRDLRERVRLLPRADPQQRRAAAGVARRLLRQWHDLRRGAVPRRDRRTRREDRPRRRHRRSHRRVPRPRRRAAARRPGHPAERRRSSRRSPRP